MNKSQLRQIETFNTVLQYLEQNRSIWEGSKSTSHHITEVEAQTRVLMDKMRRQSTPINGATQEKQQVRVELEVSILKMATHLAIFANKTGDPQLAAQCEMAPSILGALSREALGWTGERIHQSVTRHLAALAEFGITEADAGVLQSLLQKYQDAKNAPRRAIADRARETTTLPALIRGLTSSFRHLDRLMAPFRTSHPEFFAGYRSVRMVIMRGPQIAKAQTTSSPAAEANADSNAQPNAQPNAEANAERSA